MLWKAWPAARVGEMSMTKRSVLQVEGELGPSVSLATGPWHLLEGLGIYAAETIM